MTDIEPLVRDGLLGWVVRNAPASAAAMSVLLSFEPRLPAEYRALLAFADGGEGPLGAEPGWFQLWSPAEAVEFNTAGTGYGQVSGYFGIGTNGGGELLAFALDQPVPQVVMIPLIGMTAEDAEPVAPDPVGFLKLLGHSFDGT